jgi:hypothetical protein
VANVSAAVATAKKNRVERDAPLRECDRPLALAMRSAGEPLRAALESENARRPPEERRLTLRPIGVSTDAQ